MGFFLRKRNSVHPKDAAEISQSGEAEATLTDLNLKNRIVVNMSEAQTTKATSQCTTCTHWQARGGLVEARQYRCTAIEEEKLGRVALLMVAVAQDYAQRGRCPMREELEDFDGAYRSVDLIDQQREESP